MSRRVEERIKIVIERLYPDELGGMGDACYQEARIAPAQYDDKDVVALVTSAIERLRGRAIKAGKEKYGY